VSLRTWYGTTLCVSLVVGSYRETLPCRVRRLTYPPGSLRSPFLPEGRTSEHGNFVSQGIGVQETVHPAFEWLDVGAYWAVDSSRAIPPHPELTRLGLLPSGSDPIHDASP
jgi:hypothetical protein